MNSFPKTEYWRPLVPNYEIVDKTTNQSFKSPCAPSVLENESEFGMLYKINMLQYHCVHNNIPKYEEFCE